MSFEDSWRTHFRHDTFRTGQDTAIDSMAKKLDEGEKFIIAELPTGIGKSDAAMALAKSSSTAYITTSQNILIDQYERDFGTDKAFALVKGKRNYECSGGYDNCLEGSKNKCYNLKNHKDLKDSGEVGCKYMCVRNKATQTQVALTNTTYFALGCANEEVWPKRELAIIDEAHNLPSEVMGITEMMISDRSLKRMFVASTIPFRTPGPIAVPAFGDYLEELKTELMWTIDEWNKDQFNKDMDVLEDMSDLVGRITWFQRSVEAGIEWIVDYTADKKSGEKLVAKPLDTSYFAQKLFFEKQASQFILQSATIVDFKRYAEELGIDSAHTIRRSSPFDLSRRPIYDMGTADMSYKKIDSSLPAIAQMVHDILENRPNQKGIVHTASYKVQNYLKEYFGKDPRCLFPDTGGRSDAIKEYFDCAEPKVMFSPSMTEGIDGRGDSLRFQIICKIPYPSLGDRRVKIKTERNYGWYQYQTLKTLIQAIGRGMRSENDWCDNFVLDSGFSRFLSNSKAPSDFTKSVLSASEGMKFLKHSR